MTSIVRAEALPAINRSPISVSCQHTLCDGLMQEPEIVRLASFERPQAFSPQGQAPLGMAAQLLQDTKDLLELQLWESALILVRASLAAYRAIQRFSSVDQCMRVHANDPCIQRYPSLVSSWFCMRCSCLTGLTGCDCADQLSAIRQPTDAGAGPDGMPGTEQITDSL